MLLYRRVLPAVPECVPVVREELRDRLSAAGVARTLDIGLVVTEAWTNAVLHAYLRRHPGPVAASALIERRDLVLAIEDRGRGFAPRPDSPGGGLGLSVMRRLADDVRISSATGTDGTLVVCRFDGVAGAAAVRGAEAVDPAHELRDYLAALQRTSIGLRQDAEALAAEAAQAIAHSLERRRRFAAQRVAAER